jgi:ring-1,2-phenylacetyl-CoA epoxidase subunit PaaC
MATTSITIEETPLVRQLLERADDALILGHRLSEWTGHAPLLEEELALANIALDLIGQARLLYEYAATLTGHSEDQLAYLRDAQSWRNCLIMELPNGDFAFSITRLLLVSAFVDPFWRASLLSSDATIAAIAAKAEKETAYHLRHAGEWFQPPAGGAVFADPATVRATWDASVQSILSRATLARPQDGWMQSGGRDGRHTEHLGYLLADMQFLQRAYPGGTW